jgi:hypothetical protein
LFHELPIKTRVDILFYLCQTRLDQESPEFMHEMISVQNSIKQAKEKKVDKKPKKKSDDKKDEMKNLMSDPIELLFIKPIG